MERDPSTGKGRQAPSPVPMKDYARSSEMRGGYDPLRMGVHLAQSTYFVISDLLRPVSRRFVVNETTARNSSSAEVTLKPAVAP